MLHGLMMTSDPSYILIKPNTLRIIESIREFRFKNDIPVCFTLDAGANVHVLFPDKYSDKVYNFIETKLKGVTYSIKNIPSLLNLYLSNFFWLTTYLFDKFIFLTNPINKPSVKSAVE